MWHLRGIQSDNCAEMLTADSGDIEHLLSEKPVAHYRISLQYCMLICISCYMLCTHSPVVKVTRRCLLSRQWTAVDFSGCILSSPEEQAFLVFSLWASVVDSTPDQALAMINISMLKEKVWSQAVTVHWHVKLWSSIASLA